MNLAAHPRVRFGKTGATATALERASQSHAAVAAALESRTRVMDGLAHVVAELQRSVELAQEKLDDILRQLAEFRPAAEGLAMDRLALLLQRRRDRRRVAVLRLHAAQMGYDRSSLALRRAAHAPIDGHALVGATLQATLARLVAQAPGPA